MHTDKKRILTGESREDVGASERQSVRASFLCCLCCLGCLLFESATARADTASYAATDGASYTSAKVYSFCPTAPSVFASATHVWHMEEASGNSRVDSVGSENLLENGAVASATGIHGNCASLQVANAHTLGNATLDTTDPQTISFWFKVSSLPTPNGIGLIGSDVAFNVQLGPDGKVTYIGSEEGAPVQSAAVTANTWHLVVVTSDTTQADPTKMNQISVDGATFVGDNEVDSTFEVDSGIQTGGSDPTTGVATFLLDEIYMWNVVKTQSEVNTLWNSGAGNFAP